jgi:uncharacterized membrane protein YdjX (TVP38/TMEM64 family)
MGSPSESRALDSPKETQPQSCLARWWPKWSRWTWFKVITSIIACVLLCVFFYWFSAKGYLAIFLEWVKDIGYWGNLLFVVAFTLTGLPFMLIGYTPLGLAAGFIYGQDGPILGILNASVTVLIGTITGSIVGFWSCRVLCKSWFQRKINESPTLQAFMHTMESKGFYLILIMRMAPIPFGVQNGLFSVSNVSVLSFSVATIVGLVPEILMLVYMGTTMADRSRLLRAIDGEGADGAFPFLDHGDYDDDDHQHNNYHHDDYDDEENGKGRGGGEEGMGGEQHKPPLASPLASPSAPSSPPPSPSPSPLDHQ